MNKNKLNLINNLDLKLYYYGTQECSPNHSWGPAIKEHFKIHYIHKGKGIFRLGNETYHLEEGQGFLICPNVIAYYKADDKEPWSYSWCAFDGINAEAYLKRANLTNSNPIFEYNKDDKVHKCFEEMIQSTNSEKSSDLRLQSLLYLFLATIIDEAALDLLVRQGKALYVGISNYGPEQTKRASEILKKLGTPCLINQLRYSMFDRHIEGEQLEVHKEEGIGTIAFVPLAQGLLTDKYINGIPRDSRIGRNSLYLHENDVTEEKINKVIALNELAKERGQSLAQMALAWDLRGDITSVLIGASKPAQVEDNVKALDNLEFTKEELDRIDQILK